MVIDEEAGDKIPRANHARVLEQSDDKAVQRQGKKK